MCIRDRFEARRAEGKGRLGLLAQEVARLAGMVLTEYAALQRKLPQAKMCIRDSLSHLGHNLAGCAGPYLKRFHIGAMQ